MQIEETKQPFVHLHVHTEYSLLDGSAKISELVLRAKELGMQSLAITDHGAMYGVIDFYKAAKAAGIKPIIGCEVYIAEGSRLIKENTGQNPYYHLVLLAETNEGYQNLIKLVSYGFIDGFYYKPRIDKELLKTYHAGIIGASACLAGEIPRKLLTVSYEKARESALEYQEIFGEGNFFLEMQDHGIPEQRLVNTGLRRLSKETGIPMICTNDSHYIYKEDSDPHDILMCIQTAKTVHDEDRMRYEPEQFYLRSPREMYDLFPEDKDALQNTARIAERCNVDFVFHDLKLPRFAVPEDRQPAEYLRSLCTVGLSQKYADITPILTDRLNYELDTIERMGYVDYFLIVWDFIRYARERGIIVGPGRGSAAGSLVSYCLSITTIDPIAYDLIFERFLNPERISMPDIDIDFCYERRQEVIDYVVEKYGDDHVAQIITFGTMAARAAIKDVGRALDMPYADVDRISKMIPTELGITLERALKLNPSLRTAYAEEPEVRYLLDTSMRLEGLPRHASTHAAGVVICREPTMEFVPLHANGGVITTQFPMNTLEELGLLKMDFLGLRTLTVIQSAVREIERIHGITLDMDAIDYDDPAVFQLIAQAKTEGVFQLESSGMKQFMKELAPACLEDLIAGISLYRPGPMDFIPKYVKGKRNPENIRYTHPALQPILHMTYGCIVYQEQVMQIVRDLAGYSLGRSDLVRRAMSKKKADVMAKEREGFVYGTEGVPGCAANGIPPETAEAIFDEMTDFAKYAFNKSHAACYAVVGYQTAWLKTYYPLEFMAALLTSVMDNTDKVSSYIEECKKMQIQLLPPDINEGYAHFSVSDGKIRFGLAAIKNVGRGAIAALTEEREKNGPFASLTDFCRRLENNDLNKRWLESFIAAGALDSLGGTRPQYMAAYKNILAGVTQARRQNIEGQLNLFDMGGESAPPTDTLPNLPDYPVRERLAMEKEVLGIYVSGHPLAQYETALRRKTSCTSHDLMATEQGVALADGTRVTVGGLIVAKSIKYTRTNQAMAFVTLEDRLGLIELIFFPEAYAKFADDLIPETAILADGRANIPADGDGKVIVNRITPLDAPQTELWLALGRENTADMESLYPVLRRHHGTTQVMVYDARTKQRFGTDPSLWVAVGDKLLQELSILLGEKNVVLKQK